ncbi:hypothetical protein GDO78_004357 [Eleutherodactylus coqui]|uniref:Uncharacterized protein n=1 Tax=Eleutherodactylus coqui TaxID=57060 RepID=A0A8J6JZN9_ELECQ|nr:hypothetical protein GDO78_004357 [Eleutherodactylus coqui]
MLSRVNRLTEYARSSLDISFNKCRFPPVSRSHACPLFSVIGLQERSMTRLMYLYSSRIHEVTPYGRRSSLELMGMFSNTFFFLIQLKKSLHPKTL